MKTGRPGIAIAAIGAGLLAGCGQKVSQEPPPRATDAIVVPPQTSVIAVPVRAPLSSLTSALEGAIPRTLWTIDRPDQACVPSRRIKVLFARIKTPTIKCRIVGNVTRGPLGLSGNGRTITLTMPVNATVRAQDIGGILKQETATAKARVRAVVRLDVADDWSPRGTLDLHYTWVDEPHLVFLGQRIGFTSRADDQLKGVIARLQRTLPRELDKLRLRPQIANAWGSAFTSVELNRANPPVWMRITPEALNYGGYTINGQTLTLNLGMKARTETFIGPRPADPVAIPLPPVHRERLPAGEVRFAIPVIADYAELEPVLVRALTKRQARPFDVPGLGPVMARFDKVTAYGTTGNRIAVGLEIAATTQHNIKTQGTVWLTALPVNQENSRRVGFEQLAVSGVTDSAGGNLLLRLANAPALSRTLADALGQNFDKDFDELMGKITHAIEARRKGDLVIRGKITEARTGRIAAAGQGLYLPVSGTGTASIELARK